MSAPEDRDEPDCFGDDDDDDDGHDAGDDCGRWDNGALSHQCVLAGTEWCDWECPIGLGRSKP